jgi:hypothetical protein
LLLTVLLWPVTAIVRRRYGAKLALPPQALLAYRWSKLAALAIVLGMSLWAWAVSSMLKDNTKLTAAFDGILGFVQLFGTVAFLGGFAAMAWNLWAVWTGKRRWPARTWSVVLLLSALLVFWIAVVGKLIGRWLRASSNCRSKNCRCTNRSASPATSGRRLRSSWRRWKRAAAVVAARPRASTT